MRMIMLIKLLIIVRLILNYIKGIYFLKLYFIYNINIISYKLIYILLFKMSFIDGDW